MILITYTEESMFRLRFPEKTELQHAVARECCEAGPRTMLTSLHKQPCSPQALLKAKVSAPSSPTATRECLPGIHHHSVKYFLQYFLTSLVHTFTMFTLLKPQTFFYMASLNGKNITCLWFSFPVDLMLHICSWMADLSFVMDGWVSVLI